MHYFVYILQSEKNDTFYTGYSKEPLDRTKKHNRLHKGYTSRYQPWNLVYIEGPFNKRDAIISENQIKALRNREAIEELLITPPQYLRCLPFQNKRLKSSK